LNVITPQPAMPAGGDQSPRGAASQQRHDDKADTLGAGLFFFLSPFAVKLARS
jgi:hypothetical protein